MLPEVQVALRPVALAGQARLAPGAAVAVAREAAVLVAGAAEGT